MPDFNDRNSLEIAAPSVAPVHGVRASIPRHVIEELSLQATLVWAEKNAGAYPKRSELFGDEVAKLYREILALLSEPAVLSPEQAVSRTAR